MFKPKAIYFEKEILNYQLRKRINGKIQRNTKDRNRKS